MSGAWIHGIGVLGGFGCGRAALEKARAAGGGAPQSLSVPTGQGLVELPAFRADLAPLDNYVPKRVLRRMDRFARMALLGACLALEDAGQPMTGLGGTGLILGSGRGATGATLAMLNSIFEAGDVCASPIHFANSLHNAATAHLALVLGVDGPAVTLSQGDISAAAALMTAKLWLQEKRVAQVLVGCVEELSEVLGYAWLKREGKSKAPGEGAAFLLLKDTPEEAMAELAEVQWGCGVASAPAEDLVLLEPAPQLYGSGPMALAFDTILAALLASHGQSACAQLARPGEAWGMVTIKDRARQS